MTSRHTRSSLTFLLLLSSTIGACGSDTATPSGGTDGDSPETSATDHGTDPEAMGDSEASESTGDAESSGSTSAGEAQCELPQDEALGDAVATITIENNTAEPRFVSPYSSFVCNYAQIEVLLGGEPVLWDHPEASPVDCSTCSYGCSDGGTHGLIINPGQIAEIPWNGGYWENSALSEACGREACEGSPNWVEGDAIPDACQVRRTMQATEYSVRVNVFDTCPLEPDACGCDEDVCEVFFYEPQRGDYAVEAEAVFPAGATVVIE